MALIDKELKEKISRKLKNRYELTVYNKDTLEQAFTTNLTRLKVLYYVIGFAFLVSILVGCLFVLTPLSLLLPAQENSKLERQLNNHVFSLDSIKHEIKVRDIYFANLQNIMQGKRHIFNLGHGILPDVPVENAKHFVSECQRVSKK